MKKNTAYTIGSLVILLICAFCFVILPALTGSGQTTRKLPPFGKYDGKEITMEEGSPMQQFAANYSQMLQAYGQQLDEQAYFYILSSAFNSTAAKYAYDEAVKDSGYVVTSTALKNKMIPYFLDENGKYSSKLYKQTPDAAKKDLRDSLEDNLYTTRFYDDNFGSDSDIVGLHSLYGIKTSDAEIEFMLGLNKEKRGFNMAYFPSSNYPTEEVAKYGKANADKFTKYNVSVVTVADKAEADKVEKRLTNNEITFEDAITEYSNKSFGSSDGKLADTYEYELENMITVGSDFTNLKNLTVGTVSSVIPTTVGYSIFKADAAPVVADMESEATIEAVKSYITRYESSIIEDYFTAKANNLVNEANKTDFKTACVNQQVSNIEIAPFPLNYGNLNVAGTLDTSNSVLSNADINENFLKTAFSLKLNEVSKPFVMNGNVVVLEYTTNEVAADDETPVFSAESIKNFDEIAAQSHVLDSDLLENHFAEVYFNNFMN